MTIRAYRFQADVNSDGLFVSGQMFDQALVTDPVTGEESLGKLIGPTEVTPLTDPELFAALNARACKCDERVAKAQKDHAASIAAIAAVAAAAVSRS